MRDSNDPEQLGLAIIAFKQMHKVSILEAADALYTDQATRGCHFQSAQVAYRSDHWSTLDSAPQSTNLNGDLAPDLTPERAPVERYREYMD